MHSFIMILSAQRDETRRGTWLITHRQTEADKRQEGNKGVRD